MYEPTCKCGTDALGGCQVHTGYSHRALEAERDRLHAALTILADPENWAGDPLTHDAALYGHDTPYELAVTALDAPANPLPPTGGRDE